jgi:antitoxin CptB
MQSSHFGNDAAPSDGEGGSALSAALDTRRKRARFRAWHRGTREMDLIMGRFADREMATLSETDLALFEALLEERESDVFAWVTGKAPVPPAYAGPLLSRLSTHQVGAS